VTPSAELSTSGVASARRAAAVAAAAVVGKWMVAVTAARFNLGWVAVTDTEAEVALSLISDGGAPNLKAIRRNETQSMAISDQWRSMAPNLLR